MPKGVANLIPDVRKYDKQRRIKRKALAMPHTTSYYKDEGSSNPAKKKKKKVKKGSKKPKLSAAFGEKHMGY